MGKRYHCLHGIKRHIIISNNVQDLQHDHAICLHTVLYDPGLINLHFSLTVTQLEDFSLSLLYLDPVTDPASGKLRTRSRSSTSFFPSGHIHGSVYTHR